MFTGLGGGYTRQLTLEIMQERFLIYDNYLGPAKSHTICRVKLLHKYFQAPYMRCSAFPVADNEEGYVSQ